MGTVTGLALCAILMLGVTTYIGYLAFRFRLEGGSWADRICTGILFVASAYVTFFIIHSLKSL